MAKASFNSNKPFHQQIGLNLRKKVLKFYIWSISLYGAETWTLRKVYYHHRHRLYSPGWALASSSKCRQRPLSRTSARHYL
jgi:hypothetical protein